LAFKAIPESGSKTEYNPTKMEFGIAYGWEEESYEAKVRWWQSLTVGERMQRFAEIGDIVMALNPGLVQNKKHAEPIPGRVVVLELPKR
jgi:hypothetical protein